MPTSVRPRTSRGSRFSASSPPPRKRCFIAQEDQLNSAKLYRHIRQKALPRVKENSLEGNDVCPRAAECSCSLSKTLSTRRGRRRRCDRRRRRIRAPWLALWRSNCWRKGNRTLHPNLSSLRATITKRSVTYAEEKIVNACEAFH